MKKYYVTTPIYYVNAAPHIGHAYTTIAADVLARFMRARGKQAHLLTGTDEHGSKIEQVAAAAAKSPKDYADEISAQFKDLWKHLDIHHDDYIRTTEPRHEKKVQELFALLQKNGDIYKGHYTGYYCVSDETFFTETEAPPDKHGKRWCPNKECGKPLQMVEEESYFFKLSKYQQPLLDHYKAHPGFLMPRSRSNEILRFVEGGLQDISVSRTKVKWGIQVPGDPEHTIYVWFDALINYLSAADGDLWPADVHIVGKEIYRFHTVIWPAMLLSAGLPLPQSVFAHGWWTVEGQKMSKSKGNFIDPRELTREYGVDAFRYFLLREVPFGGDGDFSKEAFKKRYNAELANDFGNLVSRVVQMVDNFLGGALPPRSNPDKDFYPKKVAQRTSEIAECMEKLDFSGALGIIWSVIRDLNGYVNEQKPWELAKTDKAKTQQVLFDLVWSLRIVTGWVEPFMPQTAAKIHSQLGVRQFPSPLTAEEVLTPPAPGSKIQKGPPLFPRKP
jgi:methionyl-tRNA synthetase